MGKLNLLHHKSYHPYKADNVAKVKADEAKAAALEDEDNRRTTLAESEARVDRLRVKSKRREREGQGEGEKELARQLAGAPKEEPIREGGSRIVRAEKGKAREVITADVAQTGHINFWQEFEVGGSATTEQATVALAKTLAKEKEESFTKVFLAKVGDGDPQGWYASRDGKTERERKDGVEGGLERAYKDGEVKRLTDPLAMMNAYLKRRTDVQTGAPRAGPTNRSSNGRRERYPLPQDSERGDLSPVITSLLAPWRRRGEPPAALSSTRAEPERRPPPTQKEQDGIAESQSRLAAEKARTAAFIAAHRRSSTQASDTPQSEIGSGEYGGRDLYNSQLVREANERRGGRAAGMGGWEEQKRRRDDRGSRAGAGRR